MDGSLLLLPCLLLLLTAFAVPLLGGDRPAVRVAGRAALPLAFLAASVALGVRWARAGWGHPPVADWYESLVLSAWSLLGIFLATRRRGEFAAAEQGVAAVAATAVAGAVLAPSGILPLAAILRSRWLTFHAVTLAVSYGAFALAFVLAARSLMASPRWAGEGARAGAAAALALAALGSGDQTAVTAALPLIPLALLALGGAERHAAFHVGSWWTLFFGLALAESGAGRAAAAPLVAGVAGALLSLAASPLLGWRTAARIGAAAAPAAIPLACLAAMLTAERFPWAGLPLAVFPLIPLAARRRPSPRVVAIAAALLVAAAADALRQGRGSFLLAALLVLALGAFPGWQSRDAEPDPARAAASEEAALRMVLVGFPLLTAGIASGSAWARQAWGSFWGWDPKETWSLVLWLWYGAYLHARISRRWRGAKAALFLVVGLVLILFTYIGVSRLLPGLHSYL